MEMCNNEPAHDYPTPLVPSEPHNQAMWKTVILGMEIVLFNNFTQNGCAQKDGEIKIPDGSLITWFHQSDCEVYLLGETLSNIPNSQALPNQYGCSIFACDRISTFMRYYSGVEHANSTSTKV